MGWIRESASSLAVTPIPDSPAACLAEAEDLLYARDRVTSAVAVRVGKVHAAGAVRERGHASTKTWLRSAAGMTVADAGRLVTLAVELARLPQVRARFAEGSLSEGYVSVICAATKHLTDEQAALAEPILLELAEKATPAEVATAGRYLRQVLDPDGDGDDADADYDSRFLVVRPSASGGMEGEFRLPREAAARLRALLDAYAKPKAEGDERPLRVRNADALIALLEQRISTELLVLVNAASLPDDPVPGEAAPDEAAPDQDDPVGDGSVPGDAARGDAARGEAAPEGGAPDEDDPVGDGSVPGDAARGEAARGEAARDGAALGDLIPDGPSSGDAAGGEGVSGQGGTAFDEASGIRVLKMGDPGPDGGLSEARACDDGEDSVPEVDDAAPDAGLVPDGSASGDVCPHDFVADGATRGDLAGEGSCCGDSACGERVPGDDTFGGSVPPGSVCDNRALDEPAQVDPAQEGPPSRGRQAQAGHQARSQTEQQAGRMGRGREPGAEPQAGAGAAAGAGAGFGCGAGNGSRAEPRAGAGAGSRAEPRAGAGAGPRAEPRAGAGAGPRAEPEAEHACGRCGHQPDRTMAGLLISTGQLLPVGDIHRLARTSRLVRIVMDADGQVLDMGRAVRLATPAQRRAVLTRYTTCWTDGCPLPAHLCQLDHLDNWSEGGETNLDKLGPACGFHNRDRYLHPERYIRHRVGKDRWGFTYIGPR